MQKLKFRSAFSLFVLALCALEIISVLGQDPRRDQTRNIHFSNLQMIFRPIDGRGGSGNSLQPEWGAANVPLRRINKNQNGTDLTSYTDGLNSPVSNRTNPRTISNIVGDQTMRPEPISRLGLTSLFTFWGQFVDHTLILTEAARPTELFNIDIPADDVIFRGSRNVTKLDFTRNGYRPSTNLIPRQHINHLTSFLDLSTVYGNSQTQENSLRASAGGRLKTSAQNLLPRKSDFGETGRTQGEFVAGDPRTNENLALISVHTLMVREHNRLADEAMRLWPSLSNNEAFRIAKAYNIAQFQKITMKDWLPKVIGKAKWDQFIGEYEGCDPNLNPTLFNEFGTAAFRFGHTLLVGSFPHINQQGYAVETPSLVNIFLRPDLMSNDRMNLILRGLTRTHGKEKSRSIIDDVRNNLVLMPDRVMAVDLYSLNIQRGRDHGLLDYRSMRENLGLGRIDSFDDITRNIDTQSRLSQAYNGDLNSIDPWPAMMCEDPVAQDAILGPVAAEIVARSFANMRNGDLFWYQNKIPRGPLLTEIQHTTLADIIARNTDINREELQDDVFKVGDIVGENFQLKFKKNGEKDTLEALETL